MPNRLADSTSPYLLQHQDNPVDWFEWGQEAFDLARDTDRPVLLSIGYSACHWCHVMAHESFEDPETAAFLNEHFVSIKVDREERPDIDRIYMDALQTMRGHGGWPLTAFLTANGKPFFAGTYFPKEAHGHGPTFQQVLHAILDTWREKRSELNAQADHLAAAVRNGIPAGEATDTRQAVDAAITSLEGGFDTAHGGFGDAPKFPQAPVLEFLMRAMVLEPTYRPRLEPILRRTLDAMSAGGIYDHVGGGFARYSVDRQWLIPHFEKMLYDNALLARVYLWAGVLFGEERYTATARETLDYLATGMRDDNGGLHAAEDADSEGVEGKYYVWSYQEFRSITGADADMLSQLYGVTEEGNFEGSNHLHLAQPASDLAAASGLETDDVTAAKARGDAALDKVRRKRIPPGRDDKVIAAWNGFALRAFAEASAVLEDQAYRTVAEGIARFVTTEMIDANGRLMRSWRRGRTSGPGFAIDYAAMAIGLFALYQTTGDEQWFTTARDLTIALEELFGGTTGFYSTGSDQEQLIARPLDLMDNPIPSANSLAVEAILINQALTGRGSGGIDRVRSGAARMLDRAPHAVPHLLGVLMTQDAGIKEIALVGPKPHRTELERVLWESWRPDCVIATSESATELVPLLTERHAIDGTATAYVCRDFTCDLPVNTPEDLRRLLGS